MADATKIGVADATKMGVANARVAYLLPPINGSPDVPARVAPPLIGIAASVARVSVFLPDSTSALFVTLCWWVAGVMGCTGVYWVYRGVMVGVLGCAGVYRGVLAGVLG